MQNPIITNPDQCYYLTMILFIIFFIIILTMCLYLYNYIYLNKLK